MAFIDRGILALKNGKLITDFDGYDLNIHGVVFHSNIIMEEKRHKLIEQGDYDHHPELLYLLLCNYLDESNKKVFYWQFNGVQYRTKHYVGQTYLTTFSIDNGHGYNFYKVLQGYDISLYGTYTKTMSHTLEKFLGYTKKIQVLPHVFY